MMGLMVSFGGCGKDSPTGPLGQKLEVKTEEWDNGNIKREYQFYRDDTQFGRGAVMHGYYKEYDEDGTLRVDGTYYEGKKKYNGKWVGYYDNGQIKSYEKYKVWSYKKERPCGWMDFTSRCYKDSIKSFRDGKWVEYDREGNITSESCWDRGKVDCP